MSPKQIILSILAITFMACISDDDSIEPSSEMISFRVDLVKLTGVSTSGDGGDGNYEVYGRIIVTYAIGSISDQQILWTTESSNFVGLGEPDLPITGATIFSISSGDLKESSILVNANLMEYDSNVNNADDPIGNETLDVSLSSVASTPLYELVLNDTVD